MCGPETLRHQLGGYREYAPPSTLARVAEAVWRHRTPLAPRASVAAHRVIPDPALSLAFTCVRDAEGRPHEPKLLVVGPITRTRPFPLEPGFEMAAVKLKLEWAERLLGVTPSDHADALDDMTDLLPRLAEPLIAALIETRTAEQAVRVLVQGLAPRAAVLSECQPPLAGRALDLVRGTSGRVSVERLASCLSVSVRHLRRVVHRDAAVSLKRFARTVRFIHAVTMADRRTDPAWARLAAESGYCDQSHLIREFHALAGTSPRRLYRERRTEAETSNPG